MKQFFNPILHPGGNNCGMPPSKRQSDDGLPENDFSLVMNEPITGTMQRQKTLFKRLTPTMFLTVFWLLVAVTSALGQSKKKTDADIGADFKLDNMIRDLVWNETKGCIEFKVLIHDTWAGD